MNAKMSEKCLIPNTSLARMKSAFSFKALDGGASLPTFPKELRERNEPLFPLHPCSNLRCDIIWQRRGEGGGRGAGAGPELGVGRGFLPFFSAWLKGTFVWHSETLRLGACFLQACEERKND